ncbi:uncharacterized protein LOC142343971 isoform X2 [Convolutriloba macropyga]|uniref:uncharacterized protein LOC142343971 isoform X2 n=1 Tax=Convolutriloba macropyga TaxID=536237 RepID=UPI003F520CA7
MLTQVGKFAHTLCIGASLMCIILVGMAGLYLGPKCVSQPGRRDSICVIVRSSQVGGALIAVGVTITVVFILIAGIEIQTRYFPFKQRASFMDEQYARRLQEIREEVYHRRASQVLLDHLAGGVGGGASRGSNNFSSVDSPGSLQEQKQKEYLSNHRSHIISNSSKQKKLSSHSVQFSDTSEFYDDDIVTVI